MDKHLASAKKGDAAAQFQIGYLYYYGNEVQRDYKKAMEWFLKAANQGVMYHDGFGVPIDYKKAMEYYLKAAEKQVNAANFSMGLLFANGSGVPQDHFKALELYYKALDGGFTAAQDSIDSLTKKINAQKAKILAKKVEEWTVSDVISWMSTLKLSESYKELIQSNNIDGQVLVTMTSSDWKEIGVKSFGDIRKLETAKSSSTAMGKYIMISYNWEVQPMVKRIKHELSARGYNVWIDIERMQGSTLETMATAVEGSALVLICFSKGYKDSAACRTEGEYAFTLKKPIIPLKMDKTYAADGWLGALLGSKLYHAFYADSDFNTVAIYL